jgi:hypothetical protein
MGASETVQSTQPALNLVPTRERFSRRAGIVPGNVVRDFIHGRAGGNALGDGSLPIRAAVGDDWPWLPKLGILRLSRRRHSVGSTTRFTWKVVLRKELTAAWTPRRIAERGG